MSGPQFDTNDVMTLLDIAISDPATGPDAMVEWFGDHVTGPGDAFVLIYTLAWTIPIVAGLEPNSSPDDYYGVVVEVLDQAANPASVEFARQVGQLIAAGANNDADMLGALVRPIVDAGPKPAVKMASELLTTFRRICLARELRNGT